MAGLLSYGPPVSVCSHIRTRQHTLVESKKPAFWAKPLFVFTVIVPMLVGIVYYSFFALDRYESTADVVVRQPGGGGGVGAVAGLAMMVGGANPTSREETLFLQAYVTSADMLQVLEREVNWTEHYQGRWTDPLYWLPADSTQEEKLAFYQRVVLATFDETNGLLKLSVQGFDAVFAQQVLDVIVTTSQAFVNELSRQMAREQLRFSQGELALARRTYEEKRQTLIDFQRTSNVLDLEFTAQARATLINELESELVKARAEMSALISQLSVNSPQVQQKRSMIDSLEKEIAIERQRLTSSQTNAGLNVLASEYRELTVDAGIAEEAYKFAVASVENARIEATKQLRALLVIVQPNLPDEPSYPERLYNLVALLLGLLMLYGIFRFIAATIDDHRD